jgi:2-polyprenyl-3-methyl-5-hydroxy-6-metoxy-1,4-benzoquinol methylase
MNIIDWIKEVESINIPKYINDDIYLWLKESIPTITSEWEYCFNQRKDRLAYQPIFSDVRYPYTNPIDSIHLDYRDLYLKYNNNTSLENIQRKVNVVQDERVSTLEFKLRGKVDEIMDEMKFMKGRDWADVVEDNEDERSDLVERFSEMNFKKRKTSSNDELESRLINNNIKSVIYEKAIKHYVFGGKETVKRRERILDIGIGRGGDMLRYGDCYKVVGLDISDDALRECRRRYDEKKRCFKLKLYRADISKEILDLGKFDLIFMNFSLQHMVCTNEAKNMIIKNLSSLIEPHGVISIVVPDSKILIGNAMDSGSYTSYDNLSVYRNFDFEQEVASYEYVQDSYPAVTEFIVNEKFFINLAVACEKVMVTKNLFRFASENIDIMEKSFWYCKGRRGNTEDPDVKKRCIKKIISNESPYRLYWLESSAN